MSARDTYFVPPADTDPAIHEYLEPHVVCVNREVTPNGLLYVFFPGSFGKPENTQLVLENAADLGYLSVGLRYPNQWTVGGLCNPTGDTACFEAVRMEIIDGLDRTPLVSVDRTNCIENRLVKLLAYMENRFPQDGWGSFLVGGEPRWERIAVSGHSQGGGQAGVIARHHEVARVVMFSSPADAIGDRPAVWVLAPHATPTARWYGFAHGQETGWPTIREVWNLLGMRDYGEPVLGETAPDGFLGAHEVYTLLPPAVAGEEHGSTAVDRNTPLDAGGTPLHARTWAYIQGKDLLPPLAADFSFAPVLPTDATPVTFTASASGGTPPYTDSWDFCGAGASGESVTASLAAGTCTVTLTVTDASGATATASKTVEVGYSVAISSVTWLSNPSRLKVSGSGFDSGCQVEVNGAVAPKTTFKSDTSVVAKGSGLKAMLPKGVSVQVTLVNPDGGRSAPYAFRR